MSKLLKEGKVPEDMGTQLRLLVCIKEKVMHPLSALFSTEE